jgi:hypothetical protein
LAIRDSGLIRFFGHFIFLKITHNEIIIKTFSIMTNKNKILILLFENPSDKTKFNIIKFIFFLHNSHNKGILDSQVLQKRLAIIRLAS